MNSKAITAELETITPEMAEQWLSESKRINRNQTPSRVKELARLMQTDQFLVTGDTITFDWNGDIVNGHHRLAAIIQSGKSCEVIVVRGVDPLAFKYVDYVNPRSVGDINKIAGIPNARLVAAAARMVLVYENGFLVGDFGSRVNETVHRELIHQESADDIYQEAAPYASALRQAIRCTDTAVATFYVLAIRTGHDTTMVQEFLDGIASGADLPRGGGQVAFRNFMMRQHAEGSSPGANVKDVQLAALIEAFTRYRDGKRFRGQSPAIRPTKPGKPFPTFHPSTATNLRAA